MRTMYRQGDIIIVSPNANIDEEIGGGAAVTL
jgi:hypothetical protein